MKRIGVFLLVLLWLVCMMILPVAAAEQDNVFEVIYEETTFMVDLIEQTITYDGVVCQYEIVDGTGFKVLYPDGSYYLMEKAGVRDSASWSEDYDPNTYVSGPDLWNVLGRRTNQIDDGFWKELVGWVFLVIGALNVVSPKIWWKICYGWWSKNTQPNKVMLNSGRMFGLIAVIVGVFLIK